MIRQLIATEGRWPEFVARAVAGVPLVGIGMLARVGAPMAAGAMAVALFTHLTFQPYVPAGGTELFTWSDEPPVFLPIAVLAASLFVALRGAGAWSIDRRLVQNGAVATAAAVLALLGTAPASAEAPEPTAARAHYELEDGVALQGYDAVAYFAEGKAVKGDRSFQAEFEGVSYRFASAAHRDAFLGDPDRYRPAYGGWCAWAMADGGKTQPDPTNFIVAEGRLFLFFKNFFVDTKKKWKAGDPAALETQADTNWAGLIGT